MILSQSGYNVSLTDFPEEDGRFYVAYFIGYGPVAMSKGTTFISAARMSNDTYIQHPDGYSLVYIGERGRMLDCILLGEEFVPRKPFRIAASISPELNFMHIEPNNGLLEGKKMKDAVEMTDIPELFWEKLNEFYTNYYEEE